MKFAVVLIKRKSLFKYSTRTMFHNTKQPLIKTVTHLTTRPGINQKQFKRTISESFWAKPKPGTKHYPTFYKKGQEHSGVFHDSLKNNKESAQKPCVGTSSEKAAHDPEVSQLEDLGKCYKNPEKTQYGAWKDDSENVFSEDMSDFTYLGKTSDEVHNNFMSSKNGPTSRTRYIRKDINYENRWTPGTPKEPEFNNENNKKQPAEKVTPTTKISNEP